MKAPHPELVALHAARFATRNTADITDMAAHSRRRAALFAIDLKIAQAERRHGRTVYTFKRCGACALLHPLGLTACNKRGEYLYQLFLRLSPDVVSVIE